MIVGVTFFLSVIQKSNREIIDGDAVDVQWSVPWHIVGDCPLSNALGVILLGFLGAVLSEVDSLAVDSDKSGASVVTQFGWSRSRFRHDSVRVSVNKVSISGHISDSNTANHTKKTKTQMLVL